MDYPLIQLPSLSDAVLVDRLKQLAAIERRATALLLAHLIEFDKRRLYADLGLPSLFAYCVRELGYSEGAAYKRIQAARAARDFPAVLDMLSAGQTSLAAVVILGPHLTLENHSEILRMAGGRSSRDVEFLVAQLAPRPDAKDCLRRLRVGQPASTQAVAPAQTHGPRAQHEPLSGERFLFRFTGSAEFRNQYKRARALLHVRNPGNVMAAVFEAALKALLSRIDPQQRHERRLAARARRGRTAPSSIAVPGPPSAQTRKCRSRMIPLHLRDAVWCRDGGRCAFIGPDGRRCPETVGLELDHIVPWAVGGSSTDTRNLRLACRQHNLFFARRRFGAGAIEKAIQRRREETRRLSAGPDTEPGLPTVRADSRGAQKESE